MGKDAVDGKSAMPLHVSVSNVAHGCETSQKVKFPPEQVRQDVCDGALLHNEFISNAEMSRLLTQQRLLFQADISSMQQQMLSL